MQNLHDDNYLDDLSRKAAQEFQLDQDLHSWQKLHPRLEAALPSKKERKRRFLILFFMFLLVGGGITVSAILIKGKQNDVSQHSDKITPDKATTDKTPVTSRSTNDQDNSKKQQPAEAPSTIITDNATPDGGTANTNGIATPDKYPVKNKKTDPPVPGNRQKNAYIFPERNIVKNDQRTKTKIVNEDNENTAQRKGTVSPVSKTQEQEKETNTEGERQSISKTEEPRKTDQQNNDTSITGDQSRTTTDKATDTANRAADKPIAQAPNEQQKPLANNPVKNNKQSPLKNRWEFGLTYAPDISTVKFTHTRPPGHNIGLTVGYNLSRRFSLQTGIIYTIKNYKSRGEDYHPPKGYWTNYVKLETVTGECNMWDIPLNLRYNLAPRKKSNFFISTGLSSYLMQKEDYNFFYYYNGAPVNRYRSMDSASKHWMAVLNFSVGYERQISKVFSLQVEPFFKQPLKGVGFGDLKLNSTGLYFTLKYKPLSGKLSP